jgi:phage terminase Nu1 subunit (DNA packaging protein)
LDGWFIAGCPVAERTKAGAIKALDLSAMARWRRQRDMKRKQDVEPNNRESADLEKTLLIREQRIGQELKNAQARHELAPVDLISWTLSKVGAQISAILDSVPLKVKNILPRLSAAEVEHIRREIVKAQNAAASVTVDLDEYYERSPGADQHSDPLRTADT